MNQPSRLLPPFRTLRFATLLAAGLAVASPATAQWGHNPHIVPDSANSYEDGAFQFEMSGQAFVMQSVGQGVLIQSTRKGYTRPQAESDPNGPRIWVDGDGNGDWTIGELVGCKVAHSHVVIAYHAERAGQRQIRAAKLLRGSPNWNDFTAEPGFPVTIGTGLGFGGTEPGFGLSISPRVVGTDEGALVAWQRISGGGSVPPRSIFQQGVTGTGALVWASQQLVANGNIPGCTMTCTDDGLGVVTYLKNARFETTKLDSAGAVIFRMNVPGQGVASHSCLVAPDGSGGAFYSLATNSATNTNIVISQVTNAGVPYQRTLSTNNGTAINHDLRPLAMIGMPGSTFGLVWRDTLPAAWCARLGEGLGGFAPLFNNSINTAPEAPRWVSGASTDNSDAADMVLGPPGLAIAFSAGGRLMTKCLDPLLGVELPDWVNGGNPETDVNVKGVGSEVRWPHVWNSGTSTNPKFVYGWYDSGFTGHPTWDHHGFYAEKFLASGDMADGVTTINVGTVGLVTGGTVFFDVALAEQFLFTTFDLQLADPFGTGGWVEIHALSGMSHVGNTGNASLWTLLDSVPVTAAGPGHMSRCHLTSPIVMQPGTTGIAIRTVGLRHRYSVGNGTNQVYTTEGVTLTCGAAMASWPGGTLINSRVWNGAIHYNVLGSSSQIAVASPYGIGCGSGPLRLAANRPVLGSQVVLQTSGIAPGPSFGLAVVSTTSFLPGFPLGGLGMPGCHQFVGPDAIQAVVSDPSGALHVTLTLPNAIVFEGLQLHAQMLVTEPVTPATPLGFATSNAVIMLLGRF